MSARAVTKSRLDPERIVVQRMLRQRLWGPPCASAQDAVQWLTAVQAQDYAAAKWALALRSESREAEIEDALQAGRILRTHVMRPTWHFVLPRDLRWLLALTAPHVRAQLSRADAELGLDAQVIKRSLMVFERALRDGKARTRDELLQALQRARVRVAPGRPIGHLMMHAELASLVCSGPRRGKQFTYALLEERAESGPIYPRDEALAQLAARYFASHGPALLDDFSWWSGLKRSDAQRAIEACPALRSARYEDRLYWFSEFPLATRPRRPHLHLLPNFDEYVIAYRDHRNTFLTAAGERSLAATRARAGHFLLLDGWVVGSWRRDLAGRTAKLTLAPQTRLDDAGWRAVEKATLRYEQHLGVPMQLVR